MRYIALIKDIIKKLLGNKWPILIVSSKQLSHREMLNKLWDNHYPSKVLMPGEKLILLPGTLFEVFDGGDYWSREINKRTIFWCDETLLYRTIPMNEQVQ